MNEEERRELADRLYFARYLVLPLRFDASSLLREVSGLLGRFVTHREELGAGSWKALSIRNCDGQKESVGRSSLGPGPSRCTAIAAMCPSTIAAVDEVAPFENARRIRFMLLEPGARIAPHRDADATISLTLNLCVTYPAGCRFHVGVDPDGAGGDIVPFSPGTFVLLNVADRHAVHNDSEEFRLHVVVESPLRMSDDELLGLARERTGAVSIADIRAELLRRFVASRGYGASRPQS